MNKQDLLDSIEAHRAMSEIWKGRCEELELTLDVLKGLLTVMDGLELYYAEKGDDIDKCSYLITAAKRIADAQKGYV